MMACNKISTTEICNTRFASFAVGGVRRRAHVGAEHIDAQLVGGCDDGRQRDGLGAGLLGPQSPGSRAAARGRRLVLVPRVRSSRGAGCACAGAGSGDAPGGAPSPLPASAIGGQAAGVGWSYALADLNDGQRGGASAAPGVQFCQSSFGFLVSHRPLARARIYGHSGAVRGI